MRVASPFSDGDQQQQRQLSRSWRSFVTEQIVVCTSDAVSQCSSSSTSASTPCGDTIRPKTGGVTRKRKESKIRNEK